MHTPDPAVIEKLHQHTAPGPGARVGTCLHHSRRPALFSPKSGYINGYLYVGLTEVILDWEKLESVYMKKTLTRLLKSLLKDWKTSFEKLFFSALASKLNTGFINKGFRLWGLKCS